MNMLSNGNKKYRYRKDIRVMTFGLPPVTTCPGAGWCKKICYAMRGNMGMPMARKAQARRFEASKRADFADKMIAELGRRKSCNAVRIHDSGDFYDSVYLGKWVIIAKARPDITFFAYTKMVTMFKNMREALPTNLKVIFSMGGKWDNQIDTVRDCHSRVFETRGDAIKAGYKLSPDNLPLSFHKPNITREAFVYHGAMKYENCMRLVA